MEPAKSIGDNIRKVREQKGVKQEVLAKHLNITKSRMSQIENGDCGELTINRIEKIAIFLEADFFQITSLQPQTVHITNSTNCSGFYATHTNISPELVQMLANELAQRMNKK